MTDTQVFAALVIALIPGILAFRLGTELYKQKFSSLNLAGGSSGVDQPRNVPELLQWLPDKTRSPCSNQVMFTQVS